MPRHSARKNLSRRDVLKGAATAGLAAAIGTTPGCSPKQRDLILSENEKAGTTDWQLTNTRVDPKTKYRCP